MQFFPMKRKRRQTKKERNVQPGDSARRAEDGKAASSGMAGQPRHLPVIGVALIVICTIVIYGQTTRVPPIDYEDPFYLVHSLTFPL
jgi:hypothetical protein